MDFRHLKEKDPQIFSAIKKEILRQENTLELIASENAVSLAILEAQSSPLTNKYAEGYPKSRWYGGCKFVDEAEDLARQRAKSLFSAEYANVQPHSGTQANMAVMFSVLEVGDTILAMDLACGGHLSHGHPLNFSGKFYKVITYGVDRQTELIDYGEVEELARRFKPKLIIAGASAYPRIIDFSRFREIADKVGAFLLVDMAHFAGLVAAGLYPNPCAYAEFVTATTHKTLRGPRGGFILAKKEFSKAIDSALFPGIQGGPLMHVIAAKAVCFKEAQTEEFKSYQKRVLGNCRAFCEEFKNLGLRVVSGGTDSHLLLLDLRKIGISGKKASLVLEDIGITVNKNLIPYDPKPPSLSSGIRIGTPVITTRGMGGEEVNQISQIIYKALTSFDNQQVLNKLKEEVGELAKKFPLYPEIEI
ncbi:MAG TPA: serine hydroxymethyltransferase [Candidatus Omnitrophica bacterium]|nr:MAG: serine hydroxymethyltransferase [Candidatus Omnitrophota bacterium]RKY45089.1 MAG: serine hydroxymethyltransferase [Candidatus Omnitrophota bacterium]HEC69059.1 serine hydroxymethyltransferase [Candidatus Omnitrophota bacterium]